MQQLYPTNAKLTFSVYMQVTLNDEVFSHFQLFSKEYFTHLQNFAVSGDQ